MARRRVGEAESEMKVDLLPWREPVSGAKVGDLLWPAPLCEVACILGEDIPRLSNLAFDVERRFPDAISLTAVSVPK